MSKDAIFELPGEVVVSEEQIRSCLCSLSAEISEFYYDHDQVVAIVLLEGAKRFAEDLFATINQQKFIIEYLKVSSYDGTESNGKLKIKGDIISNVHGKDVLLIDDICDTGHTIEQMRSEFKDRGAGEVRTCVLLERKGQRDSDVEIDFHGLKISKGFVVGYGLDHNGQYRELPFIAALDEDFTRPK